MFRQHGGCVLLDAATIREPILRAVYDYWQKKRGDLGLPARRRDRRVAAAKETHDRPGGLRFHGGRPASAPDSTQTLENTAK